jgi:single-stranded-DNA-specific exonuclease
MIDTFVAEKVKETVIDVSIITFGADVKLHTPFTPVSDLKNNLISKFDANGMTPLGTALKMAKDMIDDKNETPSRIYRPAVVLTKTNDLATGSARSVSGFDVYRAIEHCRDLLENFGGHTYAAGLSMKAENVEAFTKRFEDYVANHILPEQTSAVIDIDAEIDFRDITPRFHSDLKKFNPFGPDNHKPVFCTHNVYDYGTSKVVGREQEHIKLELVDNKSNNVMNGIAFGQSSQARYIKTKRSFDICYTIEENTHKRGEVQLQIEDIKPSEE